MIELNSISVQCEFTLREALQQLDKSGCGILLLLNADGLFERTITDGDIRRLLLDGCTLNDALARLPSIKSIVLRQGFTRQSALELMNHHAINHLPVVDADGRVVRLLERKELDEQILLSTPHLGDLEREYVEEAFRSNWIAPLGPNVDAFERELAAHVGVAHAAALSSGTAAIHLALRMLGVGQGDVVFCSTLTFAASANPIVYQGATPVFIDSEPDSWNMSPLALEKAFHAAKVNGKLPKAVVVVNLYGQSANMDPILEICDQYRVPMVEDAAESLGASYKGKASGTFGLMGIYSFNGNKIITTSGGGMLVSDDKGLIEKARFFATQARDPAPHYQHSEIGFNYRMSNILAGVGRGQLEVLKDRVKSRREIYRLYREGLSHLDCVDWMPEPDWSYSTHWLTVCTIDQNKSRCSIAEAIKALAAERIEVRPVWKPMHLQPVFSNCEYFSHGTRSVSDLFFQNGLCLPSGSNLTKNQQDRVIEVISRIFS